jgi:hypothetical protein
MDVAHGDARRVLMNWDAIGALSELAGAAGVVLTLIYLSVQLRQNTRAIRSSEVAYRSNLEMASNGRWMDIRRDLYSDPELTSIWIRGLLDPDSLTYAQWQAFFNYFVSVIFTIGEQYRIQADLLVDRQVTFSTIFQDLFRYPGARKAWRSDLGYDVEFLEFANKIFESTETSTPTELERNPSIIFPTRLS